jgi:integrase
MPKLTAFAVENRKPDTVRREFPDAGCAGLYLIVQPSGAKSFAVRYRVRGKPKKLTLPKGITLAAARAAATAALHDVTKGIDPSAAKRQEKRNRAEAAADTFAKIAERYLHREGKNLRSAEWQRRLLERLVYPEIGDMPIGEIKRKNIVALLDDIEDNNGPVMAHSTLAAIRRIMGWHASRDDSYASPIVRGMGRIKSSERARARVLEDDELCRLWTAAGNAGPFGALVKFLLLTAARRDEARELTWTEIKGDLWSLPASRNKVKVDLLRPLSKTALALIEALPRVESCAFVFTTTGKKPVTSLSKRKAALDAAAGVTGWTLHDLRRSSRSLMSRAGINSDHAERCLGHAIGGVRQTYDRHQYLAEKRNAYEALAALIERVVNPPEDNVVPLRG